MAIILAYLIIFTIGINLLDKAGLFAAINDKTLCSCIKGFMEMTVGINQMGMCNISIEMKAVLAAMMVSFGGMCIVGQSASMTRKTGIGIKDIFLMKITHGMIAAIVNAFTGVINSNISILGTVVCIVGFSIAIIAIVMLEKQRMKKE